uniref:N-(5'-phosphoribosyl)anthranilate isomerase n=1 Tax=Acetithermum autotrophicum TaxID=1446466 RepID=H5SVE0_ACEAU|nr:N-(5'-phosphoribosyl)anthranilate isomerase [Candidatus Acetothermum autotrophicum]
MVMVKICGIRSEEDIAAAEGADALGFIVSTPGSPRNLEPARARALIQNAPPALLKVVVTTCEELDQLLALGEDLAPDALQVHSALSVQKFTQLRALTQLRLYGLLPIVGPVQEIIARGRALAQVGLDGVILDTVVGHRVGGTGRTHDWTVSRAVRDALHPMTVIIAGGLTPQNVQRALAQVRPAGVDVASGVEEADGRKSRAKIRAFIHQVRSYENSSATQNQAH